MTARHAAAEDNRATRWTVLLDRIAEGDVDACGAFYDESSGLTFSLMMHILQNWEAAEETLVKLYRVVWTRARLDAHRTHDPVAWLVDLARSAALSRLRQTRRSRSVASVMALPSAPRTSVVAFEPFHRESQAAVGGLSELTHEQRSIIQLTYFGGLSARETADRLGLPLQRVTREIQLAMQVLRHSHDASDVQ
jgi:RNA polymerase sigma-70 factor (ECF subfamily)